MRKVYLENIPYEEIKDGKIRYLWTESIGMELKFEYDEYTGSFLIIGYGRDNIKVLYNNKEYSLLTKFVKNGNIAKIFEKDTHWSYQIGDAIKDQIDSHKRNLIITNRKYYKNQSRHNKFYQYICKECGYDFSIDDYWVNEMKLKQGRGCPCCSGRRVVKGINDIATTAPWMKNYIVNENDWYSYTKNSNINLLMKCPFCGKTKHDAPYQILIQGFACHYCSDGISYPEKFLMNVLEQLNIEYEYQLNKSYFSWIDSYRYDFYIPKHNCIIETHGLQHYKDAFNKKVCDVQKNDEEKYQLAIVNNIDKYIVLNCMKSDRDWIKQSIESSILVNMYDLSIIDYNKADEFANNSILIDICNYYKNNYPNISTLLLSEYFNISRSSVTKYLKTGTKLGLCEYKDVKSVAKERGNKFSKPIKVTYNNDMYYFRSVKLMKGIYKNVFGKTMTDKCVYAVLKGKRDMYDNRVFEYCSKSEFNLKHEAKYDKIYGEPFILSLL